MVCHDGPQEYLASEDTNAHLLLGYQLVDKGRKTTREKETCSGWNPEMWMHKPTTFRKPMQRRGKVWQSHGYRCETLEEYSCRDLFGSIKEHLP